MKMLYAFGFLVLNLFITLSLYFVLWFVISSGPVEINYEMWMVVIRFFCVGIYILIGKKFKKIMIRKFNGNVEEELPLTLKRRIIIPMKIILPATIALIGLLVYVITKLDGIVHDSIIFFLFTIVPFHFFVTFFNTFKSLNDNYDVKIEDGVISLESWCDAARKVTWSIEGCVCLFVAFSAICFYLDRLQIGWFLGAISCAVASLSIHIPKGIAYLLRDSEKKAIGDFDRDIEPSKIINKTYENIHKFEQRRGFEEVKSAYNDSNMETLPVQNSESPQEITSDEPSAEEKPLTKVRRRP